MIFTGLIRCLFLNLDRNNVIQETQKKRTNNKRDWYWTSFFFFACVVCSVGNVSFFFLFCRCLLLLLLLLIVVVVVTATLTFFFFRFFFTYFLLTPVLNKNKEHSAIKWRTEWKIPIWTRSVCLFSRFFFYYQIKTKYLHCKRSSSESLRSNWKKILRHDNSTEYVIISFYRSKNKKRKVDFFKDVNISTSMITMYQFRRKWICKRKRVVEVFFVLHAIVKNEDSMLTRLVINCFVLNLLLTQEIDYLIE